MSLARRLILGTYLSLVCYLASLLVLHPGLRGPSSPVLFVILASAGMGLACYVLGLVIVVCVMAFVEKRRRRE